MLSVGTSTSRISSSTTVLPTGLMAEVQALEKAIADCNWPRVRELSQSLVGSGRQLAIQQVKKKGNFNPLPVAENLFKALAGSNLQWEDDTRHHLARAARLFLELTCMKSVNEEKELYSDTKENLRTQIDKLLEYAQEEQVGLRYELTCSSEALKLIEKFEISQYLPSFMGALFDMNISSVPDLLKLIPNLIKQMSEDWFPEALYISWTGTLARDNLPLFEAHCVDIAKGVDTLEIAQTAVDYFGDLVWNGSPDISYKALTGVPSLISLASQQSPKRMILNLPNKMWSVRYRAVQILSTLTQHQNPGIAKAATVALLDCTLRESNPKVRKLLEDLEKFPEIRQTWKEQFEVKKDQIIEQNVQEREELDRQEKALKEREKVISQKTAANQITSQQLAQEKLEIKQQRQFVEELRRECLSHRNNAEKIHMMTMKGINHLLDEIMASQSHPKPVTKEPSHFICPITQCVMDDPVIADDEHSYERAAIERWLQENGTSPITGLPISKRLISNRSLRDAIEAYRGPSENVMGKVEEASSIETHPSTPSVRAKKPASKPHLKKVQSYKTSEHLPPPPPTPAELLKTAENYLLGREGLIGRKGVTQDIDKAIELIKQLAEGGQPKAQCYMGWLCDESRGHPDAICDCREDRQWAKNGLDIRSKDNNLAFDSFALGCSVLQGHAPSYSMRNASQSAHWYKEAAKQGNANGEFYLGVCYQHGLGVSQNIQKAIKWYTKAAEQGHAAAQFNLGLMYEDGEGLTQDITLAVKWIKTAQDQTYPPAVNRMGVFHFIGKGVKQNVKAAAFSFRIAANQGNAKAQHNLAVCLEKGHELTQDLQGAVKWYTKSAEQEYAPAQYNLAICYEKGEGVNKSREKAIKWFTRAADQGYKDAVVALEKLSTPPGPSPAEQLHTAEAYLLGLEGVTQDIDKAIELIKQLAEGGQPDAQCYMGWLCDETRGKPDNRRDWDEDCGKSIRNCLDLKAMGDRFALGCSILDGHTSSYPVRNEKYSFAWYCKAAEQGSANGEFHLGVCYENGHGVRQITQEARKWYSRAAEQNHLPAQFNLALMYEREKDYNVAVRWYTRAAERGYAAAEDKMGYCYASGIGVKEDHKEAFSWFTVAAKRGYAKAQHNLGVCYEHGLGVKKDISIAMGWYKKAAGQDYALSLFKLGCHCYPSIEYFKKAALLGYADAQYHLGLLYKQDARAPCEVWGSTNLSQARKWFNMAAQKGHKEALEEVNRNPSRFT